MSEIVKVQKPLNISEGGIGPALVYAKSHKNTRLVDITDDILENLGDQPKAYFHATWTGKTWVIKGRAPDQEW